MVDNTKLINASSSGLWCWHMTSTMEWWVSLHTDIYSNIMMCIQYGHLGCIAPLTADMSQPEPPELFASFHWKSKVRIERSIQRSDQWIQQKCTFIARTHTINNCHSPPAHWLNIGVQVQTKSINWNAGDISDKHHCELQTWLNLSSKYLGKEVRITHYADLDYLVIRNILNSLVYHTELLTS